MLRSQVQHLITHNMYRIFFTLFSILHSLSNIDAFYASNTKSINMDEYPFIVSIDTESNHICSGALISQKHVLTPEHCVRDKRARNLRVLIGMGDLLSARKYGVASIMRFDDWTKRHHSASYPNNDVAILTLEKEVIGVEPGLIDETSRNTDFYGKTVVTAGWEEDNDGNLSRYLQKSTLKVLTPDQCNNNLYRLTGSRYEISERYFCTATISDTFLGRGIEGSPILYNNLIIGLNHGRFLDFTGDRPIDQNLHIGLKYYRRFIRDILSSD